MRVQFLVDFRGKLTREQFYLAGEQAEFDAGTAQALVSEGRAAAVSPTPAPDVAPAAPAKPKRTRQTSGGVL
jgi:hypothetical protein